MKFKTVQLFVLVMVSFGHFVHAQNAQQRVQRKAESDASLRMYKLKSANAIDVVKVLHQLGINARFVADSDSNSVLVSAGPKALQSVEDMIVQLDKPATNRSDESAFIKLKHRRAKDAAELLHETVLNTSRARVAVDEANQMLLIDAQKRELDRARALVAEMDQPRDTLLMKFYFIRGKVNRGHQNLGKLPEGLHDVLVALNEQGVSELELLAPLSTRTREGSEFGIEGSTKFEGEFLRSYRINGNVLQALEGEAARLRVQAGVRESDGKTYKGVFSIETTLTVPVGEYVVLAAAPGSSGVDEVIALAVYVQSQ